MKRILLCVLTIISLTGVCLIPTRQNEAFGQCNAYTIQRSGCCSHHGGVCVIPVTDNNEIYLVKQFRYPFRTVTREVPAGKLEKGEDHAQCGKRELLEETGCTCSEYTFLGEMYPTPAYNTEITYMYLARGLSYEKQSLDPDEFLDVEKMPLSDAAKLVMEGKIPDGKTQIVILKAAKMLGID